MERIDKKNADIIHRAIKIALESVSKQLGISIQAPRMTYGESDFRMTISGVLPVVAGESAIASVFRTKCEKYGLKPHDLGRVFVSNGKRYKITGLKPVNRKYPIIADNVETGKSFKFTASNVIIALGSN